MKATEIRKCLTHRLDGTWEWSFAIFFEKWMFADCLVKSYPHTYETQEMARHGMDEVIEKLGLVVRR